VSSHLVDAFLSRLAPALQERTRTPELDRELEALVERARAEVPGVELDPATFVGYVAERVTLDAGGQPVIGPLRAGPLWIACGCVLGDAAAIAAFETTYGPEIGAALRKSFDTALSEDAELRLRERLLLVGEDEVPRLASYSGRGDLRAWLRAAAVRTAIDLMRARRSVALDANALDDVAIAQDPLLAALKQRYREEFRIAFGEAAKTLTDRERTLLRYRFFDGLSIDEIGQLYRVHRATVARWIAAIRERLFEDTRAALVARLGLAAATDVDSILHLIDSQLDISVEELLRP